MIHRTLSYYKNSEMRMTPSHRIRYIRLIMKKVKRLVIMKGLLVMMAVNMIQI